MHLRCSISLLKGAGILGAILLVASCSLLDLRDDLREMDKFGILSGRVIDTESTQGQVVLAIVKDEFRRDHLFEARIVDPAMFQIKLPSGKYFLFAYKDENRDFQYQPEEPAGYFGDPTPLILKDGAELPGLEISLERNLALPAEARRPQNERAPDASVFPRLWAGRKNVGALITLDDHRFEPKFASMGLWQPVRFTLDPGPGLFFLEPYSAGKKPVLFVHGIGGSPRDWRSMIESLDRRRFQPWVLTYASGLPLQTNARYLLDAVRQIRKQYRIRRLSLVAHSMGGLVAWAFIGLHDPGETQYLDLLVTVSTPWNGHSAAEIGRDFSPVTAPVWVDMAPSSPFITKLGEVQLPSGLDFHLLFGYGGTGFLGSRANDGTLTVASQLDPRFQFRATRIYGFDAGHVDILSREDVKDLITRLLVAKSK